MTDGLRDLVEGNAPCYVYDRDEVVRRCRGLRSAMPGVRFLYSLKANPFPPLVEAAAAEGFGADASSSGEVLRALECGIAPGDVFYSSPGKTDVDISRAAGRCTVIADSLHEMELLDACACASGSGMRVGIRVNPSFGMGAGGPSPSRFGVDEDRLGDLLGRVRRMRGVEITGIHVHLRSQVLDAEVLSRYYRDVYALAERVSEEHGADIRFVNFGSGLGTVYDPASESPADMALLSRTMADIAARNRAGLRADLIVETGRYVACSAGTYYARVVDVKESMGVRYAVVDGGMGGFLRPALAGMMRSACPGAPGMEPLFTCCREAPVSVPWPGSEETEMVTVVGNLCSAMDVLAEDVELPRLRIGDIVAISNAGSYARTLSPLLFADQRQPGEFMWGRESRSGPVYSKTPRSVGLLRFPL
ncbi:MAG: alanine racemase [Thermoplasmata archaeon]|nr:alanine racemase [Thermoplasmata archaeon]